MCEIPHDPTFYKACIGDDGPNFFQIYIRFFFFVVLLLFYTVNYFIYFFYLLLFKPELINELILRMQ